MSLGSLTFRKLEKLSNELNYMERAFLASVLGLAELSMITFILLIFHLFYVTVYFALFIGVLLYMSFPFRTTIDNFRMSLSNHMKEIIFSLLALMFLTILIMPLSLHPPVAWDSIEAYLPMAKMYANSHFLSTDPYLRGWFFPQGASMLFSMVYLMASSAVAVQLFNTYLYLLIFGGLVFAARRIGGFSMAIMVGGLTLGLPFALWLSSVVYTDTYLALLIFSACYVILIEDQSAMKDKYVITGLLCGAALAVKQTAGVLWLIIFGMQLYTSLKYKSSQWKRDALMHIILFLIMIIPWYIRSYLITGNPVYPFAIGIFGNHGPWTLQEIQGQVDNYNLGKFGGILLSPAALIDLFKNNYGGEGLVHPFSVFLSIGVVLSIFSPTFWSTKIMKLNIIIVLFFLFTSFESVFIRYLYPIIPLMILLAGIGWNNIIKIYISIIHKTSEIFNNRINMDYAIKVTSLVTALIFFLPGLNYLLHNLNGIGIVITPEKEKVFLEEKLPAYKALNFLNSNYNSQYKVYAVHLENMKYYADGQFIGDWFGPDSFGRFMEDTNLTPTNLNLVKENLSKEKFDFMLLSNESIKVPKASIDKNFEKVYDDGNYVIIKPIPSLKSGE